MKTINKIYLKWIIVSSLLSLMVISNLSATALVTEWQDPDVSDSILVNPGYNTEFEEIYIGTTLESYSSHDGYRVLDGYADDLWVKTFDDALPNTWYEFNVTNGTPYEWSDYHFIFDIFDELLAPFPAIDVVDAWSDIFDFWSWDGYELKYWDDVETVAPGQTVSMRFLTGNTNSSFVNMTQFPTTVPEPTTALLLGLGLLCLARSSRKK